MKKELPLIKTLLTTLIVIIVLYYGKFIFYTPIDYHWPKDVVFRNYSSMIEDIKKDCDRFCYNTPFEVETQQLMDINLVRKNDNTFIINSETYIWTSTNIDFKLNNHLNKSKLEGIPEIFLNDRKFNLQTKGDFYEIDTLGFTKENTPNIFKVRNLKIKRDIFPIDEIKKPLFFNKDNYVESINLPQIFPIFTKTGGETKEFIYNVEIPQFYTIDKATSGFQKVSFVGRSFDLGHIGAPGVRINIGDFNPIRTGTIKQTIYPIPNKDIFTFKTTISLDNPFYSFEVSFIPSKLFFIFILVILLTPLFVEIQSKYIFKIKNKFGLIVTSYVIIFSILGLSLFNMLDIIEFISKFIHFTSRWFVITLLLFPLIYFLIIDKDFKRIAFKYKEHKIIFE